MSKKKTISLSGYVARVAERKAKLSHGGNFSTYISYLICQDNPREIKAELLEERKPVRISNIVEAEYDTACPYCSRKINIGDKICFAEGYEKCLHAHCCKKDENVEA
jgi:hypothetical protein